MAADDDHYIKLVRERFGGVDIINLVAENAAQPRIYREVDGKPNVMLNLKFTDGKPKLVGAGGDASSSASITPVVVTATSVQLRLGIVGGRVRGEFRPHNNDAWQLVGECPLPIRPLTRAGLLTLLGSKDTERWVEFRDFTITSATQ